MIETDFAEDFFVVVECGDGASERDGPSAPAIVGGIPEGFYELVGGDVGGCAESVEWGKGVVFGVGSNELVVHDGEVGGIASGRGQHDFGLRVGDVERADEYGVLRVVEVVDDSIDAGSFRSGPACP